MAHDLVIASRKRIEKKIFDEKEGLNTNGYTKEFRRECYLDKVKNEEENKKECAENSMFKDYNEFNKDFDKKREIPVYNK